MHNKVFIKRDRPGIETNSFRSVLIPNFSYSSIHLLTDSPIQSKDIFFNHSMNWFNHAFKREREERREKGFIKYI